MASLQSFPNISAHNVSVSEKYGQLCMLPFNEIDIGSCGLAELHDYPIINVLQTTSSFSRIDRTVVMTGNESPLKKLARIYVEEGLYSAINEAAHPSDSRPVPPILQKFAQYLIHLSQLGKRIQNKILPHTRIENSTSFGQYSETRDWIRSDIRFFKWHPNCFKIAIASLDDCIRVYEDGHSAPLLKSGLQKGITALAWRPFSGGELAVGCQNGVLMWTIDPNSNITRPLSQPHQLKFDNDYPVSSIEWSPNGCLLAVASLYSADILIFDVDREESIPLKRAGFSASLLRWSPDGSKLCCATVGNIFRVWSTDTWTPEKWTLSGGSIQSVAWSTCGSFLLFVTTADPYLFSLGFVKEQLFANATVSREALPVADLSKTLSSSSIRVGGCPQALAWCPKNRNLAVMFKETSAIAIFSTNILNHTLNITASCFLNGMGIEYPIYIAFQPQNSNHDKFEAVLTIGWSSGRVQYFPFV